MSLANAKIGQILIPVDDFEKGVAFSLRDNGVRFPRILVPVDRFTPTVDTEVNRFHVGFDGDTERSFGDAVIGQ